MVCVLLKPYVWVEKTEQNQLFGIYWLVSLGNRPILNKFKSNLEKKIKFSLYPGISCTWLLLDFNLNYFPMKTARRVLFFFSLKCRMFTTKWTIPSTRWYEFNHFVQFTIWMVGICLILVSFIETMLLFFCNIKFLKQKSTISLFAVKSFMRCFFFLGKKGTLCVCM